MLPFLLALAAGAAAATSAQAPAWELERVLTATRSDHPSLTMDGPRPLLLVAPEHGDRTLLGRLDGDWKFTRLPSDGIGPVTFDTSGWGHALLRSSAGDGDHVSYGTGPGTTLLFERVATCPFSDGPVGAVLVDGTSPVVAYTCDESGVVARREAGRWRTLAALPGLEVQEAAVAATGIYVLARSRDGRDASLVRIEGRTVSRYPLPRGVRPNAQLAVAPDGAPHVFYSVGEELHLARLADGVLSAEPLGMGHTAELLFDAEGAPVVITGGIADLAPPRVLVRRDGQWRTVAFPGVLPDFDLGDAAVDADRLHVAYAVTEAEGRVVMYGSLGLPE